MNYRKIHDSIISRARTRVLKTYTEKHHVVPKCLGGTNQKANIVRLTAKEHFIIHRLLVRIYPEEYKLSYALFAMSMKSPNTLNRVKLSSRSYEEAKTLMSKATKERLKVNNPWLGKKHSKESLKKMGDFQSNRKRGRLSKETRDKISDSLKGLKHPKSIQLKDLNTGKVYESLKEASQYYKISNTHFRRKFIKGDYPELVQIINKC